MRVDRHADGGCRECWYGSLRPRNISVPSYRPTQTKGCTSSCASEAQVRGRGSPRSPSGTFATNRGAGAGVQSNAQGQGTAPMGAWAFGDAMIHRCKARSPGWPHSDPVRPQAHLRPSLSHGEICPYRTPCHASTCRTPHGPSSGRRRSTLCPCHVLSLSGRDTFGPQDCCAGTGPPLPSRPI